MKSFLNPEEILKQLKLKKDMIAADFGSGSGAWVLPLAEELEEGKVYAIEVLEEYLSALKSKAKAQKLYNIETILANVENETSIASESLDLVLATLLFFQIEDDKGAFREIKRVLRKGGKLLAVDWKKDSPIGPKEGRASANIIKELAKELGFNLEKEFDASSYHWGLIFVKL